MSKHVNDIIQKYTSALFRNAALGFYGINVAPIKELVNPELPVIVVEGGSADVVFLLVDNSYLHFVFQTGHSSKEALIKGASYDIRLFERDGRKVHTVIIYTQEVKNKPPGLEIGSLMYNPDVILMNDYDGNAVFSEIEAKIKADLPLADIDLLNLAFLPLMKHTKPKLDLATDTIRLAKTIPDSVKREACIASAFTFASKYLKETERQKLLGVIRMTELANMLTELANELVEERMAQEMEQTARKLLKRGLSVNDVSEDTGLNVSIVEKLKLEMEQES